MTAHRFCYFISILVALIGLVYVVFADAPDTTTVWALAFGSLGVFELGHCIDQP